MNRPSLTQKKSCNPFLKKGTRGWSLNSVLLLSGKHLSANQIQFVNLIIDHLTENGVFETRLLYQSPFTDITPQGPEALFKPTQIDDLIAVLPLESAPRRRKGGSLGPPFRRIREDAFSSPDSKPAELLMTSSG
jgi:hypothetical protein